MHVANARRKCIPTLSHDRVRNDANLLSMFLNAIYMHSLLLVANSFVAFPCAALEKKKKKRRTFLCTHVNELEKKREERLLKSTYSAFFYLDVWSQFCSLNATDLFANHGTRNREQQAETLQTFNRQLRIFHKGSRESIRFTTRKFSC